MSLFFSWLNCICSGAKKLNAKIKGFTKSLRESFLLMLVYSNVVAKLWVALQALLPSSGRVGICISVLRHLPEFSAKSNVISDLYMVETQNSSPPVYMTLMYECQFEHYDDVWVCILIRHVLALDEWIVKCRRVESVVEACRGSGGFIVRLGGVQHWLDMNIKHQKLQEM